MHTFALRLVLLLAAMMAGVWPAYAGQGHSHGMPVPAQTATMAMHHVGGQPADHDAMLADAAGGADCEHTQDGCPQGDGGMAMGHCSSWLMACGTGLAGTLPAAFEPRTRGHVRVLAWHVSEDLWASHAVSPALRPPRHSS